MKMKKIINFNCDTSICITGLIYRENGRLKTKCCEVSDSCGN